MIWDAIERKQHEDHHTLAKQYMEEGVTGLVTINDKVIHSAALEQIWFAKHSLTENFDS